MWCGIHKLGLAVRPLQFGMLLQYFQVLLGRGRDQVMGRYTSMLLTVISPLGIDCPWHFKGRLSARWLSIVPRICGMCHRGQVSVLFYNHTTQLTIQKLGIWWLGILFGMPWQRTGKWFFRLLFLSVVSSIRSITNILFFCHFSGLFAEQKFCDSRDRKSVV